MPLGKRELLPFGYKLIRLLRSRCPRGDPAHPGYHLAPLRGLSFPQRFEISLQFSYLSRGYAKRYVPEPTSTMTA